jgi:diacylglycerol O-acyltransferase / wax synthase
MALETSVIGPKRGRRAVIEAEADIHRSPEEVFDYCSDHTHEPEWNIKMKDVAKLTDAPIGLGTRYRMEFTSAPSVISECVRFDPPSVWEMVGRSRAMRFGWRGRVLPRGDGAHLMLRMEIQLRGLLGLAAPLLRRRMRPELERDIATIKARLEGVEPPPPGPAASPPSR